MLASLGDCMQALEEGCMFGAWVDCKLALEVPYKFRFLVVGYMALGKAYILVVAWEPHMLAWRVRCMSVSSVGCSLASLVVHKMAWADSKMGLVPWLGNLSWVDHMMIVALMVCMTVLVEGAYMLV